MEEKKNNKGLIWLIVILIVLVLGLIGYIVYDKMLLDNRRDENTETTTITTTKNTTNDKLIEEKTNKLEGIPSNDKEVKLYGNIFDLLNEKDKVKISLKDNFKDVVINLNNVNFNFSCQTFVSEEEYNPEDGIPKYCSNVSISVNNKILFNYQIDMSWENKPFLLMTDNYIIFNSSNDGINLGDIDVFDKLGNKVFSVKNRTVNSGYFYDKKTETITEEKIDMQMTFNDNKLYYVTNEGEYSANLNYYDFTTNTNQLVENIDAFTSQVKLDESN